MKLRQAWLDRGLEVRKQTPAACQLDGRLRPLWIWLEEEIEEKSKEEKVCECEDWFRE